MLGLRRRRPAGDRTPELEIPGDLTNNIAKSTNPDRASLKIADQMFATSSGRADTITSNSTMGSAQQQSPSHILDCLNLSSSPGLSGISSYQSENSNSNSYHSNKDSMTMNGSTKCSSCQKQTMFDDRIGSNLPQSCSKCGCEHDSDDSDSQEGRNENQKYTCDESGIDFGNFKDNRSNQANYHQIKCEAPDSNTKTHQQYYIKSDFFPSIFSSKHRNAEQFNITEDDKGVKEEDVCLYSMDFFEERETSQDATVPECGHSQEQHSNDLNKSDGEENGSDNEESVNVVCIKKQTDDSDNEDVMYDDNEDVVNDDNEDVVIDDNEDVVNIGSLEDQMMREVESLTAIEKVLKENEQTKTRDLKNDDSDNDSDESDDEESDEDNESDDEPEHIVTLIKTVHKTHSVQSVSDDESAKMSDSDGESEGGWITDEYGMPQIVPARKTGVYQRQSGVNQQQESSLVHQSTYQDDMEAWYDSDSDSDFIVLKPSLTSEARFSFPKRFPANIDDVVSFWELDFQVGSRIVPRMCIWEEKSLAPPASDRANYARFSAYRRLYARWCECNRSLEQWYRKYRGKSLKQVLSHKPASHKRKYTLTGGCVKRPGSDSGSPREKKVCGPTLTNITHDFNQTSHRQIMV